MDIKNLTYMKILAIAYRLMYFLERDNLKKTHKKKVQR